MTEKIIENDDFKHFVDSKPEKAMENIPIHKDVRSIWYGSIEQKDLLLVAGDTKHDKCSSVFFCLRSLTIEPIMFLFFFGFFMNISCLSNMMMNKGCLFYFNYSSTICSNLSYYPTEKTEVEILANNYFMYYSMMGLIGAVMMVFIAPWSDKYGRKPPLLFVLMGTALSDIGLYLCAYYFESELYFIVLAKTASEMFGGFICVATIVYSHCSEVSSSETRTVKYTFTQIAFDLGASLGGLTGGLVYRYYGYVYIYVITFFLHLICLPWLILVVEETTGLNSTASWKEKLSDLFVYESLLKGWKASVRARENKGRVLILMYFLSMCVTILSYESLTSIGYVYVHHIFDWDPTTYNTVHTIFSLSSMLVLGLTILLLVRILKVSDFVLGLMGVFSLMARYTLLAFAHYGVRLYYLGYVAGYLNGLLPLAVRSSISKIVDRDELGKVFSFLATCEAVVPMIGTIAITKVFNATIDIYPNVSYLLMVALLSIPMGTFVWAFIYLRKRHVGKEEDSLVR